MMVVMLALLLLVVRKGTSRSYGRRHLSPLDTLVATLVMVSRRRVRLSSTSSCMGGTSALVEHSGRLRVEQRVTLYGTSELTPTSIKASQGYFKQ